VGERSGRHHSGLGSIPSKWPPTDRGKGNGACRPAGPSSHYHYDQRDGTKPSKRKWEEMMDPDRIIPPKNSVDRLREIAKTYKVPASRVKPGYKHCRPKKQPIRCPPTNLPSPL